MNLMFGHFLLILPLMFFLHIVDDFYLQGILAKLKQHSWWKENAPDKKYEEDYLIALLTHGFSWAFTITIPWLVIAFISLDTGLIVSLILLYGINMIIHATIDDIKANQYAINLIKDQTYHYIQIIITWLILTLTYII